MQVDETMKLKQALEYHRRGQLQEAAAIYGQILREEPDNPDALHLLGNAACQLGAADSAIMLITKAIEITPENINYQLSLGMAYRANNQFEHAVDCYQNIINIQPDNASAYFGLANTMQSLGLSEKAEEFFRKAIDLNPNLFEAEFNLGNLNKSLGKYTEAVENYRKAIALKPDFIDAHHNMGSALHALGKMDEALSSYERALKANLPETHNNIGNIYADIGQSEKALTCYRCAITGRPNYAEAHNNLGSTLRKLGRLEEAAASFGEAIRIAPEYATAHLNLGHLLLESEHIDKAASHYEMSVASSPERADAFFHLGVSRDRQGQFDAALACFEKAVSLQPDYLDALYNLGVIHYRLKNVAEAEKYYRHVLQLNPEYINAHINLSGILLDNGHKTEAKAHIDFAYTRKNIFEKRSIYALRTVLVLFDAGKGNINLEHLFNDKTNNIIDWMIAYATEEQMHKLPHYDVAFNAMGDSDLTGNTEHAIGQFIKQCDKPLLNHPDKVAATARHILPDLLAGIPDIIIPNVYRIADAAAWNDILADHLPLLIRPVDTHGGVGMVLVTTENELALYKAQQNGPVYVSHYVDYRSPDSFFRKYRMIFIDRVPYPYHLAISPNWMVHYYTADMEAHSWKLEEEKQFLDDPAAVLGASGLAAISEIGKRIDLDYAGIDFSVMPDGRILVFEANPTMLIHPETAGAQLSHKNPYIHRIFVAFETLLRQVSGR